MCKQKMYAGIVSFNPDLRRLKENIGAIAPQVDWVVVFDNASLKQKDVEKLVCTTNNVKMICSEENIGIAAALNKLMQWGYDNKYNWMLSLDQDSVCLENYQKRMEPFLRVENNLGIVAPIIVDRNIGIVGHNPRTEYAYVNTCITSGAISNIKVWKEVGEYDESMFIDSVDFEFCYRVRKAGYGIIQVSSVQLLHELGESKKRRFFFWKININGHSSFRKFYIARNNVYYPLKHHLWLYFIRGNIRNMWMIVLVLLYESFKKEKIVAVFKGWKEAYIAYK